MNVWDAINNKRAVRAYRDEALPEDVVQRILDAGRVAQSSRNEQPWDFIAVRDRARLQELATTGNYPHVAQSGLTVVVLTPLIDSASPRKSTIEMFDVGQAAANMQLAALELGVGSGIGTIHRPDDARTMLNFPADKLATILLAFGYPSSEATLIRKRDAKRRPLDDVVHYETW